MTVLSVRVNKEEENLLKQYAKINNISISQLLRDSAIEKIEDELDLKAYERAYEEYLKNPVTFSFEEVLKELVDEDDL
ncbi:MAG: CopG family transcriptional regulator [Tissierellia bacterium]|nr:CopG family transcriptional regulator [Tissierellia bacterium]